MIPYGLSEEQFVSMYRRKLDRLAGQAISEIRELLSRPIEPGVTEAHVEIFLDEYFGAPSVWAYWHGRNNKVDQADPNLFPGRSMQLRLEMQDLSSIDSQYFVEPEEFPGLRISASLISRWFAECWWKAGGWFYPVPVTLAVHDFDSHGSAVLSEGNT